MGNIGSQIAGGNSNYGRIESDYYPTPPEVTQALLNQLNIDKHNTIWEPACGEGYMSEVLISNGYNVISSDIENTGYGESGIDFLTSTDKPCDWIITNPPFKVAGEFISRCIKTDKPFALLVKSQFWHARRRSELFEKYPPNKIYALTWRPDFLFKKRGKGQPLMECIWCVWDKSKINKTEYQILHKPNML